MLMVNALASMGAIISVPLAPVLIDRTLGTNIGNFTGTGGLAASFDGNTSQTSAAASYANLTSAWVGKTLASSKAMYQAICYPSTDQGYVNNGAGTPNVTLSLYGKNGGAPSSETDGTLLGSITFADTATGGQTIPSSDLVTTYAHTWVRMQAAAGADIYMAEVQLYEAA